MALSHDLLEQAHYLVELHSKEPKQAHLRRAVSAAYYALFHLLIDEALRVMTPASPPQLAEVMRRAFNHADMKNACQGFSSGNPQKEIKKIMSGYKGDDLPLSLSADLKLVARTFVNMQRKRHLADYDNLTTFTKIEVEELLDDTLSAFSAWTKIKEMPDNSDTNVFLCSLLLYKQWQRP